MAQVSSYVLTASGKNSELASDLCHPQDQLTFVCAQDLRSFGILFDILNDIDQVGNFREEGIIIREPNRLVVVIARLADIECGLDVGVNESRPTSTSITTLGCPGPT